MPGDSETAKPEKRDREEAEPVPAAVVAGAADTPAPAAKKLKPDDAAATETPAVAAADAAAPADADAAAPAEPAKRSTRTTRMTGAMIIVLLGNDALPAYPRRFAWSASIFVEFDKKEAAEKAIARSEDYFYEGEPIAVRPARSDEERAAAHTAPAPEPLVYEAGKIIHIAGIPESGVSRESLKNAVESFGTALYVDFSFGGREAWIRMQNPAEAAATVSGAKETDGLTLAAEVEDKGTVSLVEGAEEKDYYDRMEKMRAERLNRGRGRGRGRGKGRGRGGRGRGRGRGGGGDGGGD
ncbi:expressed unknown protein [Ectocarpus siliculosus]|uniref:XRRM domain-containing protein n=1 Tax=Ectocarpus siliculosus TaxID=2880 RepID=D7FZL9_ECTSI|nr:expressed unknown protein [Ectocarpus siliculosus]|eukprot:CBJ32826.1 expressed unknown protein [Ectocarpus siliculosus]